jgi:hypothetical protein
MINPQNLLKTNIAVRLVEVFRRIMSKAGLVGLLDMVTAVGAALWIEKMVILEWSYPYCSILDDGEAAAVFGFPLPYEQVYIAGSASSSFIPWLYAVNIAVISGSVLLLLRPLAFRMRALIPRLWNLASGATAAFLLITAIYLEVFALSIGVWSPTSSFSENLYYSQLRPVSVHVLRRPRNCTASPFWFSNHVRSTLNSK